MNFSPQQGKAVDAVAEWLRQGNASPQVFRLFGYAGTGKTTLAMHLTDSLEGDSVFAAYTGKAASVLRKKGCTSAGTIHGLIYQLKPPSMEQVREIKTELKKDPGNAELKRRLKEFNKPRFTLRDGALDDVELVVIDECSMVGPDIGSDLLSFGRKVLVLGDPAQLPPVAGGGFFTDHTPDFLLTEVHRQAQGSPVINLATVVRQGGSPKRGQYGTSKVISRHDTLAANLVDCEQVIVGSNRSRRNFNSVIRDSRECTGTIPESGEKLICLKNDHEKGLLNGTQWKVIKAEDKGHAIGLEVQPWDDEEKDVPLICEAHHFDRDLSEIPFWERSALNEFDFGYAITCHKSQGSQWNSVFIQNEAFMFKEHAQRWLYTAITRASDRIIIAQ